jgi:5' nucleotidase, deoxy (Pyrimidine), cytosolic type C protein (NT5C)
MSDWSKLSDALAQQKAFSDLFFRAEDLGQKSKEEMLKTFVLSLHAEATGIVDGVNYKDHRRQSNPVDTQKILYKSVDAYRYVLAILNLWGISSEDFSTALQQKDDFLHYRHSLKDKSWKGEPVVLFDVDDVLAEFRDAFCKFVTNHSGVFVDPMSNEYYNATVMKENGLSNEFYFKTFVEAHGFQGLRVNEKYRALMKSLKDEGCWIQVLTSRPESNITAYYDTYSWLSRHDIPADAVAFSAEKFAWVVDQPFYGKTKIIAVDDSAKHSAEYVKHGVPTVVPQKTYNGEVAGLSGVLYVPDDIDPLRNIIELMRQ